MTAHNGPLPVPARITIALDAIGAEGPWVDEALGGVEPMVDQWEAGELVPTRVQVERLALLTGHPVSFFYVPPTESETRGMRMFICDRRRRTENALTIVESRIDWDGVLHVDELTPPKPPYRPRKSVEAPPMAKTTPRATNARQPVRGAHDPIPDPSTPGCCQTCHRPIYIRKGGRDVLTPVHQPSEDDRVPDPRERAAGEGREDPAGVP